MIGFDLIDLLLDLMWFFFLRKLKSTCDGSQISKSKTIGNIYIQQLANVTLSSKVELFAVIFLAIDPNTNNPDWQPLQLFYFLSHGLLSAFFCFDL